MYRKKLTALMTAAMMLFCILCGGGMPQIAAAEDDEADKTVYIAVEPCYGMPGESVPVTVDIRSEYNITYMSFGLYYDDALTPVPEDPAVPDTPKSEFEMRTSASAKPWDESCTVVSRPKDHVLYISSAKGMRQGRVTVWFDIPEDAAAGTQYPLHLEVSVLISIAGDETEYLPSSLTDGILTVTDQPAETTTAVPVEAAFDITADKLDLSEDGNASMWTADPLWGYPIHEIAYTVSENLDYIEWETDTKLININDQGKITGFNFRETNVVRGTITATAHFLDGTVLADTVSVYAKKREKQPMDPDLTDAIVSLEIVDPGTNQQTTETTAVTTTKTKPVTTTATTTSKTKPTTTTATTTSKTKPATTTATTTSKTKPVTTTTTTTSKTKPVTTTATTTATAKRTTTATTTTSTTKRTATATTTITTTASTTVTSTTGSTVTTTQTTPLVPDFLPGDLNDDGEVSVEDAQLALTAYVRLMTGRDSGLTEKQTRAADINGDQTISVDDAQIILHYYVKNTLSHTPTDWSELIPE